MRASNSCPKCTATELLRIPETGHDGLFEAYVCTDCGYTEVYARRECRDALRSLDGVELMREKSAPYR